MLRKLITCQGMLNNDKSKRSNSTPHSTHQSKLQTNPCKKEILSHKLKFALMHCDPRGHIYQRNQTLCEIIWLDVNSLGLEYREEERENSKKQNLKHEK